MSVWYSGEAGSGVNGATADQTTIRLRVLLLFDGALGLLLVAVALESVAEIRDALAATLAPLLVLAGAGSGKTRVITYRIAWLIGEEGIHPSNILAVTFTNKAANEMLGRVERLVPNIGARPWIGTFHSTSLRMLRRYADRLGYTKSFAVYDTADQLTLVRRCMRELQMSDDAFPPRSILSRISNAKNELIGPAEYEKENLDFFGSRVAEV